MANFDACELVGLLAQEARMQRLLQMVSLSGVIPANNRR